MRLLSVRDNMNLVSLYVFTYTYIMWYKIIHIVIVQDVSTYHVFFFVSGNLVS